MNISSLLVIEGGIRSFFASLAASLSFDLLFIIGLGIQLVLIIFFAIKTYFAYELRMTRALDKLNKWLFVNKKLDENNIKQFTSMVKRGPKRLSYYWQQYILYREKAPSEYLTADSLIEKPLRASSLKSNVRNLSIISGVLSLIVFIMGIAHNNVGDTVLNGSMIIVALITPLLMLFMLLFAVIIMNARKNSNLDELYQNHHLFQRFLDNACVELPAFIDFTLLFTVEEIEKGIPALREFLESRARKEKEEFDRARSEMVVYEKYDFEKAGVDGSNILERAMNESEAYLSNKSKTLAKISQFEASLESLKKNFDNIQKDFQKKMQVSKENIDRLRQQQEETTSRIESNFLRKQQATEIAKQEREEADFEQQKRRYLVEKNDYEEEIKRLNAELDSGREDVERAMLSEYQTFYKRVCQSALENVNKDIRDELATLKQERELSEDELAQTQTVVKRLQDENAILRKKLSLETENSLVNTDQDLKKSEEKTTTPIIEEAFAEESNIASPVVQPIEIFDDIQEFEEIKEHQDVENKQAQVEEYQNPQVTEEIEIEPEAEEETVEPIRQEAVEELKEIKSENQAPRRGRPKGSTKQKMIEKTAVKKGRGRPAGSTTQKILEKTEAPRGRGRPRKEVTTDNKLVEAKKRGRPAGSKNKKNSPSAKKRATLNSQPNTPSKVGRGRPRKIQTVNDEILKEENRLRLVQNNVNNQMSETLKNIDKKTSVENERKRLITEIDDLKRQVANANNASLDEIEEISQRIEVLLKEIDQLED